jgi:hypothetical protein
MSETVAGTLVGVLEKIGVKQIFGLIGDSLNSIAREYRFARNVAGMTAKHVSFFGGPNGQTAFSRRENMRAFSPAALHA